MVEHAQRPGRWAGSMVRAIVPAASRSSPTGAGFAGDLDPGCPGADTAGVDPDCPVEATVVGGCWA